MLVQIDKSRSHDEPIRVKHKLSVQRFFRDAGNSPVSNADIANSIQPRLRINGPPALDHQVVLLPDGKYRDGHQKKDGEYRSAHGCSKMTSDDTKPLTTFLTWNPARTRLPQCYNRQSIP
jgi:hypothetical protein